MSTRRRRQTATGARPSGTVLRHATNRVRRAASLHWPVAYASRRVASAKQLPRALAPSHSIRKGQSGPRTQFLATLQSWEDVFAGSVDTETPSLVGQAFRRGTALERSAIVTAVHKRVVELWRDPIGTEVVLVVLVECSQPERKAMLNELASKLTLELASS
jgi:hypothetical protein